MPDGPGCFGQGFPCPALLRVPPGRSPLSRTGLSPATAGRSRPFRLAARNLLAALLPRRGRNRCGLGSSPFARHYSGNHCCFLLLRVLRCFSSPGSPPDRSGWHASRVPGCPIRKSPDHRLPAPPQGLSQLVTSFIASGSLGIPRAPLLTFPARNRPPRPRASHPRTLPGPWVLLSTSLSFLPRSHHVKERHLRGGHRLRPDSARPPPGGPRLA